MFKKKLKRRGGGQITPQKNIFGRSISVYAMERPDVPKFVLTYYDPEKILFLRKYGVNKLLFTKDPRLAAFYTSAQAKQVALDIWRHYDLDLQIEDVNIYI